MYFESKSVIIIDLPCLCNQLFSTKSKCGGCVMTAKVKC